MVGPSSRGPSGSPPIIGRDEVLEELDRLLLEARSGGPRGCLVVGARGSGKSVVLEASVALAREHKFAVLRAHSLPEELPSPFSLVRDLLGPDAVAERPPDRPGAESGPMPVFLAPVAMVASTSASPHRSWSSGSGAPTDFERLLSSLESGSRSEGPSGRDELLGALEEQFRSRAGNRPLLLAVDDLHFADASSLEFLRRISLDRGETPTVVVATIGAGDEVPFRNRALLESLAQGAAFRSVTLRSLTLPETLQFVRWLYGGRDANPHDVLRWHAQTGGNPLFIEQLVRMSTGSRSPSSLGVPTGGRDVTEILLRIIEKLPEEDRNLLTFASVLGKEFRLHDLESVETGGRGNLGGRLGALVEEGLLRGRGGELYEFVTEGLRAGVYGGLTENRRRILHRKAGLALEARGGVDEAELARQFYLGRDEDRAISYNVAAAERAGRTFAYEDAFTHVARALEAERRRPERELRVEVRLLTEEGRLLLEIGNLRQADGTLDEAVMIARSHPGLELELGRALVVLAECRYRRGEYPDGRGLAEEAGSLPSMAGSPADRLNIERVVGMCFMREGDFRAAEAHYRAELKAAEEAGSPYAQGRALFNLAGLLITAGPERFEQALDLLSRAAERFTLGEDHGTRARVLNNRALLEWTSAGRVDDARRDLVLAIEAAERSRSRTLLGYCCNNLGQLEAEMGHPEAARPALDRAARALAPLGDGYADQQLTMGRAMVAHKERAFDEAETGYREALAQARTLHQASETAEVLMRLAELAHDRGDVAAAARWLAEARSAEVVRYRPDFAPRVVGLQASLAGPRPTEP